MVRAVWAATSTGRRLYLVDASLAFIPPVKQYLDYLAALEKSPHTLEHYCRHIKHLFTFLDELHREWDNVTPDDIVRFMQWLRTPQPSASPALPPQSPRTERTVNTILTVVSSFYRYHVQRGTLLTHPFVYDQVSTRFSSFKPFLVHLSRGTTLARALKLKEPRKRLKTVSDANFQRFFQATDNLQFRCMLLLMRQGGLRIGEVLGLQIQDLEFSRNGVWVRRRVGLENGALAKGLVTGEARFVDLPPSVMALVDQLLLQHTFDTDHLFVVRQPAARDAAGHPTYGSPLGHAAVKALFRHYSRKSGVTIHAHMLRHTHATELIRSRSIRTV